MAAFTPLSLAAHCNAGTGNIKTTKGWLWPSPATDPRDTELKRLLAG